MYRKDSVETHSDGFGRMAHPAVNVKVRGMGYGSKVEAEFKCSEAIAEKALEFAFNAACGTFWEDVPELAKDIFGSGVKVYSEGRSGGWLVVHGLPDIESWDAVMLAKWRKFERLILAEVEHLTSWETVREAIADNRWAEEGAQEYNFLDMKDGRQLCMADLEKVYRDKHSREIIEGVRPRNPS